MVAARVTNWSQISGAKLSGPIVPVGPRTLFTGAGQVFQSVFVDHHHARRREPATPSRQREVRDYVEQTPGGFGYVDLALTEPVHVIPYEGVDCTRATIRERHATRPRRPLGIVTRGRPQRRARAGSCAGRALAAPRAG